MASCAHLGSNYVWNEASGSCVYAPVDWSLDPTFTGETTIQDIREWVEGEGADWSDYDQYFTLYGDDPATSEFDPSTWWEKEDMLRDFAGIDIGQLETGWDLASTQFHEDWYGTDDYIGARQNYLDQQSGLTSLWGLMRGDIGRRETEAGTTWGLQKGGLEAGWEYKKKGLGLDTRSGLSQVLTAQESALSSIGFATAGTTAFDRMQRDIREGYVRELGEGERQLRYGIAIGEDAYDRVMASLDFQRTLGQEKYDEDMASLQYLIDTGQMTYDQAMETGRTQLGLSMTDLGQALEEDVWLTQEAWRESQRQQLGNLIASGAFVDLTPDGDDGDVVGCMDSSYDTYDANATVPCDDCCEDIDVVVDGDDVLDMPIGEETCVLPGTKIETKRGAINIEDTEKDDIIRVYNFKTKEFGWSEIDEILYTPGNKGWFRITTERGKVLECSKSHAMYHPDYPNSEQNVRDIKVGDELFIVDDSSNIVPDPVKSIESFDETVEVWNYELSAVHNYISNGLLSHNRVSTATKADIWDPFKHCFWDDTTGSRVCMDDWKLPTWEGFGGESEEDYKACIEAGGDPETCSDNWWEDYGVTFGQGMHEFCTQEFGPDASWDGESCVGGAGQYEFHQDYNQTFTTDECSQMGGTGFGDIGGGTGSPGLDLCMNQETIRSFADCVNNGGRIADCSPQLMTLGTNNKWIALGLNLTLDNYDAFFEWVESGTAEETFEDLTGLDTKDDTPSAGYNWKQVFSFTGFCIPSKALIDTPNGSKMVDDIRAGDYVVGYNGKPVRVQQKIEYSEEPNSQYFTLTFDDDSTVSLSINHRIEDIRINDYKVGDIINGKTITDISTYANVTTSYDLLTDDRGYQISGAPVNSMVLAKSVALGDLRKDRDLKALLISGGYVDV